MKKNKILAIFACFLVSVTSIFGQSKNPTEDEKIIYAMLMNQLQYSLQTVEYYGDRVVLDQEYNTIICKIDKTKLKDEKEEAITAFTNLLTTITALKLNDNEKVFLEQQASKEKKEAINKVLQGTALSTIYGIQQIGSGIGNAVSKNPEKAAQGITQIIQGSTGLMYSGVSAFFNYRNTLNTIQNQLNRDLFRINQDKLKNIDSSRNSLWKTQSKFITRYNIPKRYEIKEDQMKDLIEILDSKKYDNKSKLRLLEEKKDIFAIFTPFWYELGAAYQEDGNYAKAIECYTEFEYQKKNYSIIDNDSYYTELAKNMISMIQSGNSKKDINYYLNIIKNDETVSTYADNKLYLASVYNSLGREQDAINCLELIIDKNKKYVTTARDYHEYLRINNSDTALNSFMFAQLSIVTPEEIEKCLKNVPDEYIKSNNVSDYINSKNLAFSLQKNIAEDYTIDIVVGNTYFDTEKLLSGDNYYYFVNLDRDSFFKKYDNLSVILLDKNRNEYELTYILNYYSSSDMKKFEESFAIIKDGKEQKLLDYSDLEQVNINLYLKKINEACKQKDFKSKLPEDKAQIISECYEESLKAYLSEPYVYKNNIIVLRKRILTYGLKTIESKNNIYSFDKYGDLTDKKEVISIPRSAKETYSLAMQGNAVALYDYGMLFFNGENGVSINYVEAVKWLKMAANKNNSDAYFQLGKCFEQGLGVSKDEKRSKYYYEQARKLGNKMAQTVLTGGSKNFVFFNSEITYDVDGVLKTPTNSDCLSPVNKNLFMNVQISPKIDGKLKSHSLIPAKLIVSTENNEFSINSAAVVAFKDMKNTYENSDNVFLFSIDPQILSGGKARFKLYSDRPCLVNFRLIYEDISDISVGNPQEIEWKVTFE